MREKNQFWGGGESYVLILLLHHEIIQSNYLLLLYVNTNCDKHVIIGVKLQSAKKSQQAGDERDTMYACERKKRGRPRTQK